MKHRTEFLSLAEIANIYGVDRAELHELYRKRKIVPAQYGSQGVSHLFALDQVVSAANLGPRPTVPRGKPVRGKAKSEEAEEFPVSTIETFQTAKARKMSADATNAELKLLKERGEAIDPEIVGAVIDDLFIKIRTRLRAAPDKIASLLRLKPRETQVIQDVVDEALRELSNGKDIIAGIEANEDHQDAAEEESDGTDASSAADG